MIITAFSFIMSIFWFNIFIIIITLLRKYTMVILNFNITLLLFFILVCFLRLFCFFELPYTMVLPSKYVFTNTIDFFTFSFLQVPWFNIPISLLNIFLAIWIIGIVFFLFNYVILSMNINKCVCNCEGTNNPVILACITEVMNLSGKHGKVKIIQNEHINTPLITGYFNPAIYLPDIPFSEKELKHILSHEWTHFLNKDSWIKLITCLISSVFWWNPFVHILSESLNHILEVRCDIRVTSNMSNIQRTEYLETLLKVAKNNLNLGSTRDFTRIAGISALISTTNTNKIYQRFYIVLNKKYKKNFNIVTVSFCVLTLFLVLSSYMFVLQPSYEPTQASYTEPELYDITPENAYLKLNHNNSYDLYADGKYRAVVEDISIEPFLSLPIK
ncbi:M56 family metallopeptidase [Aminipila sp.]|uniref:M56 family metallopeptidase n=1 Tax=Aminipila sp. TaxID=2060095 RepID=UPI00289B3E4B|nr:M56 family metallopeptidase [Aminipila sp.]